MYRGFTRSASMSMCSTISELTDAPTRSGYGFGSFAQPEGASLRGILSWSALQALETPQTPVTPASVTRAARGWSPRDTQPVPSTLAPKTLAGMWSESCCASVLHRTFGASESESHGSRPRVSFLKWLVTHKPRVVREFCSRTVVVVSSRT